MRDRVVNILIACALMLDALSQVGCNSGESGYHLKGKVVQGSESVILIVDKHDERLNLPAVSGAALHLQMDPGRLKARTIATEVSAPDGSFSMKVDEFGAGWLQHDVGLFVRRDGFTSAELPFRLPSESRRVLVMLGQGLSRPLGDQQENLYEEVERYAR